MKRFLILTSQSEHTVAWHERKVYIEKFVAELEEILSDTKVLYTTYNDLVFTVIGGKTSIIDTLNSVDLKDLDFVHFKNWMYELEEASVTAQYLEKHRVQFINDEVNSGLNTGKLAQMFTLAHAGISVPDTLYARRNKLVNLFAVNTPEGFTFPLIVKDNDGSKGDDNYLVKNKDEMAKILEDSDKEFVVQNFIENDGDYRLLFIGLDDEPLVFQRKAVAGSHLNNTSKGGSGQFVSFDTLSKAVKSDACKAAEVLRRELSGVDILINKHTNQHYVLEVNSTPALATGYGLNEKMDRFAKYLESQLEEVEEE